MVMAAVLIKVEREREVLPWTKSIVEKTEQHQLTHLHFRNLNHEKKQLACTELAGLPIRIFVLLSHKRNMEGDRNLRAEKAKVNKTAWFYCWLTHLLLERVTRYCSTRTMSDYGELRSLKLELSDRGGVNISDVRNYYNYVGWQSEHGMLHDPRFDLSWDVMNVAEITSYPNKVRAGLQLADIAASAFFAGVEPTTAGTVDSRYAKLLLPRICHNGQHRSYGFGVKLMPVWVHSLRAEPAWDLIHFYMQR